MIRYDNTVQDQQNWKLDEIRIAKASGLSDEWCFKSQNLETEKYLRKEAERLKENAEQARRIAQEKISTVMEQANKTVLGVLSGFTTLEVSKDDI